MADPVPQILKDVVNGVQHVPQEVQNLVVEQSVADPVPQILKDGVDLVQHMPQEHVQNRVVEHIAAVPVPQIMEDIADVLPYPVPQIKEDVLEVLLRPVPQVIEEIAEVSAEAGVGSWKSAFPSAQWSRSLTCPRRTSRSLWRCSMLFPRRLRLRMCRMSGCPLATWSRRFLGLIGSAACSRRRSLCTARRQARAAAATQRSSRSALVLATRVLAGPSGSQGGT